MVQVAVELQTAIDEQGKWEYYTTRATGQLYRKETMDVLMFNEETDAGSVQNLITIQADRVSVKRSGALKMHQQFKLLQPTENHMHHPYIAIHMKTWTEQIDYDPKNNELQIRYTVSLNGETPRQQQLHLSFT